MPRFFFHLRHDNGELERDDDGVDLPNFETAYLEAHRAAVDMWAEARRCGRQLTHNRFEIRDVGDRIVLELPFEEAVGIHEKVSEGSRRAYPASPTTVIESETDRADVLVAEGNRLVAEQRALVQRLEQKGGDAALAKAVLATFVRTQALRDSHRDQLRQFLRLLRPAMRA
jgi:hypothetical protein